MDGRSRGSPRRSRREQPARIDPATNQVTSRIALGVAAWDGLGGACNVVAMEPSLFGG